ncbi:MAG: DNA alkylation repair protein [Bacteroidetes bacterium]|nr:DNA alkylation repair protein [Bacteroidota bacterium]
MSVNKNNNRDLITILSEINQLYYSNRNETISIGMKAYLKNKFDCYGIKKPDRDKLLKAYLPQLKNISMEDQFRAVKWLWKKPQRELHYLAMEILFRNKKQWTPDILSLFEEMVLSNSWWDSVDTIATTLIVIILLNGLRKKLKWLTNGPHIPTCG